MRSVLVETMTLKNFRGFTDLTLEGLRRINFVLGPNGSGKTALLEGVSLGLGHSPQMAIALRRFRGLPMLNGPIVHLFTFFDDLFHRFDTKTPVQITLTGVQENTKVTRRLTIGKERQGLITVPLKDMGADEDAATVSDNFNSPIFFEWAHEKENTAREVFKTAPRLTPVGLQMEAGAAALPFIFFPARGFFDAASVAESFSRLDQEGRAADFIRAMQDIYPDLEEISVAFEQNMGQLWAKLHGINRKFSISLVSDGMSRIAEILLGISRFSGGVALIDEVENGIHFKKYGEVLKAIDTFSRRFGTQVFITTHNDEILDAFLRTEGAKKEDFSLIVCHRDDNGDTSARILSGEWAKLALRSGIEYRV